ncbi:hypothetical protein [Azospirillum sp.]|uniref:hypothetical protein n=1 Tax=Azospirillum sp. TaxID=34012 RepID=UPI002D5B0905|nr:hypothetical protein [Azospirillum sp.]HYD70422.1 hypothetical protein [Azospirillum sp.]
MKRTLTMAASAVGTFLLLSLPLSPAAQAQQNQGQGGGWGGALDQLNRAVNPNNYENEQRARDAERYERERRMEGSSSRDAGRDTGRESGRSEYSRWSDNDLRDQFGRVSDEQRQLQRERRAIEDEMDRRGISRR